MDARLIAIGAAGLAGLVAGGALWAVSEGQAQGETLDAAQTRLAAIPSRSRTHLDRPSDALSQALALPLLATSAAAAPNEVEVPVQVFGLARSPVRTAALLGIGGAPAQWLAVGESRGGITLRSVSSASAVLATAFGEREVALGMASPAANPAANGTTGGAAGFRSPPPPASAPGMPQ